MKVHGKVLATKNKIYDAIGELLLTNELTNITVSKLCTKANIHRSTFYRYYAVPQDVLDELSEKLLDEAFKNATYSYDEDPIEDAKKKMKVLCHSYYKNQHFKRLFNNTASLNPNLQKMMSGIRKESTDTEDNIFFIAGGVLNVLDNWALNGFKRTPEEIASILTSQITRFASHNTDKRRS